MILDIKLPDKSPLLCNGMILGKKVTEHKMCFDCLRYLSETFPILRRNQRHISNVNTSSCKVTVILIAIYLNFNFLRLFSKNTQISNFTKIRPVGAEVLQTDGRT